MRKFAEICGLARKKYICEVWKISIKTRYHQLSKLFFTDFLMTKAIFINQIIKIWGWKASWIKRTYYLEKHYFLNFQTKNSIINYCARRLSRFPKHGQDGNELKIKWVQVSLWNYLILQYLFSILFTRIAYTVRIIDTTP